MSINFIEFSALALAHFVALLSPGPDFILIVGSSFQQGYRKTLWACLGIATANGVYILLAIGGFSLFRENTLVFMGMKLLAAGYLFYLGIQLLKSSREPICVAAAGKISEVNTPQMFLRGFLSAILNPKNAIFYLSLMALIVSRQTPVAVQLIYAVWMFSMVLLWDALVAWCIGNPWLRKALDSHTWCIERISGLLLISVGVVIAIR